ncbi:unnamed protein product [Toxocara canis]|uniref:Uncharacterized protein n=1 Tax=Toxocara canis TaxID=6265 RepID=A0A183URK6_TOXCA|nr:unnamed protein product [Toxocara canis]
MEKRILSPSHSNGPGIEEEDFQIYAQRCFRNWRRGDQTRCVTMAHTMEERTLSPSRSNGLGIEGEEFEIYAW